VIHDQRVEGDVAQRRCGLGGVAHAHDFDPERQQPHRQIVDCDVARCGRHNGAVCGWQGVAHDAEVVHYRPRLA